MKLHTRIIHTSTFHTTIPNRDLSLGARWNYRCASQLTLWKFYYLTTRITAIYWQNTLPGL